LRSAIGRGLEARERRTIAVGATVVALAAVIVLGVLPIARQWRDREAVISAVRERVARLESIVGKESDLAARTLALDQRLEATGVRLVRARTPALAASSLQGVVQDYARASRVSIARFDVAGAPSPSAGAALAVPATISASGDIYGITEFLRRLQHGPRLLEITELAIAPNPTLRGNLLQLTVSLRAPVVTED
jgi:hypothetical protein